MKILPKFTVICLFFICVLVFSTCGKRGAEPGQAGNTTPPPNNLPGNNFQTPEPPSLQTEILDKKNTLTTSEIGKFDFKNFTYPFPRGWQDVDNKEFTIENGRRPISSERIGITYLTTKFGDATGDGIDEAFVVLKIDTGGGGVPLVVYLFSVKDGGPELISYFRTGDKADGGLKNIWAENGELIVELYGQDRYILGEVETMRIDGDVEQLCCPSFFTRSSYKWNGSTFIIQGKRKTFSMKDEASPPIENMSNRPEKEKGGTEK